MTQIINLDVLMVVGMVRKHRQSKICGGKSNRQHSSSIHHAGDGNQMFSNGINLLPLHLLLSTHVHARILHAAPGHWIANGEGQRRRRLARVLVGRQ
jgi:hypothetical protein